MAVLSMREWLSGGVSPCQGEGRGFESRLALFLFSEHRKKIEVTGACAEGGTAGKHDACLRGRKEKG